MATKDVVGYEGLYTVTDRGEVRSVRGGVRAAYPTREGHLRVSLHRSGRRKMVYVHALVLEAFVGPRPEGLEGRHRNGVPDDNRAENLEWGTRAENVLDSVRHGTHSAASKTHCKNGHEFTAENTRLHKGVRHCRKCVVRHGQEYRERLREAGRMVGQQRVGGGS